MSLKCHLLSAIVKASHNHYSQHFIHPRPQAYAMSIPNKRLKPDNSSVQQSKNNCKNSRQPITTRKQNTYKTATKSTALHCDGIREQCQLTYQQLKLHSDASVLPASTQDADSMDIGFGQQRAMKAIHTALGIHASGYHVFAAGENGLGKRTLILRLLNQYAKAQPTPDDCIYVHNFTDPRRPHAISLPSGQATRLQQQIHTLWQTGKKRLNQRFASDMYQSQIEAIKNDTHAKETQAYAALDEEGKQYDLALSFRPSDNKAVFVSTERGNDIANSGNDNLSGTFNGSDSNNPSDKDTDSDDDSSIELNHAHNHANTHANSNYADKNHMHKRLSQLTIELEALEDAANAAVTALHQDMAQRVLTPLFAPLITQYRHNTALVTQLQSMLDDMVQQVERIVNEDDEAFVATNLLTVPSRYSINVMVSHAAGSGAPVVFEDLPTHLNLLGHVEQITQLGTVTTDVSMIRAGSLHRANGGYLLLEASHLLEHPYAWQGLKRALQSKQIRLSSLEQMLTLTGSLSLAPEPMDLSVKVILLGEPDLYYELLELEPEFDAVFKIRADFHDDVARTPANERALVAKMADMIAKYQLLPFDCHAEAAVLDHLSLLADDKHRLSLHSDRLSQLLHESHRHASLAGLQIVSASQVAQTIADMDERSGYLRDLYWQELKDGQQLISTQGQAVGQVNALTVISYADSEFGMPARLTALIQPNFGNGDILDIERDVELGGSLHAKGMLIMTSYLRALFSQHHSLNFSASLAFEQSYAHIDGDSATLAEACALISALADVPIKQCYAITGSMNQLGEVQAVGGINAKVAGFFDACVEQGLNGQQGVILPAANINQLMLRDDIIAAVQTGQFAIYAVSKLPEALSILTNLDADKRNKKNHYHKTSLFGKISKRLASWEDETPEEHTKH